MNKEDVLKAMDEVFKEFYKENYKKEMVKSWIEKPLRKKIFALGRKHDG